MHRAHAKRSRSSETISASSLALLPITARSGLGSKALSHADEKLKLLEQETRYKQEDRQFLIDRWRELKEFDRSGDRGIGGRAQGIRRAVAQAANERGFHRRAAADLRARESVGRHSYAHRWDKGRVGETQKAARDHQDARSLSVRSLWLARRARCSPWGLPRAASRAALAISRSSRFPPSPQVALYLDTVKLDPLRNGNALLRHKSSRVETESLKERVVTLQCSAALTRRVIA